MLKVVTPRRLISSRCIKTQAQWRRRIAISKQFAQARYYSVPVDTTPKYDDKTLRQIFDDPLFWKDFSQTSQTSYNGRSAGLFQNRYLTNPEGFQIFANVSVSRAKKIVNKVLSASTVEEYKDVTRDLDRLSDLLCRVIDLSDFVRATHPSTAIQRAATMAYAQMFEYMNVLNTTTGLNKQLEIAMNNPEVVAQWSEEESVVAEILKRDFAKSAIDLAQAQRERFVELSQEISVVGNEFVEIMAPAKQTLAFPSSKLKGVDPLVLRAHANLKWGQAKLPTISPVASAVVRYAQDEEVRKEAYMAGRTSSRETVQKLEELMRKRAELAKLSGYRSYSHLALSDKMAKTPESVGQFLQALSRDNKHVVEDEVRQLLERKMLDTGSSDTVLQPWDKNYYVAQIIHSVRSRSRNSDFLSAFFSLGTVMQGLSRVFKHLYGISLVPHETKPGETWNSDVRRLDAISDTDGHVAVLYCDLFSRPGKSSNPAHFTLRCSREITTTELAEIASSPYPEIFEDAQEAANDGMAMSSSSGVLMQLPTIALICDFETTLGSTKPALLTFTEVQTLFHEMGHAIHSILGRTSLQNVSGTRCPTDFAELPSVLMEHFAADESVLGLFARHYETDEPLPYAMVREKLDLDKRFEGFETDNQIILSMLDLAYHSSIPLSPSFDSTEVYHSLQRKHSSLPLDPPGTCWQGFFGHLYGYGSTYYSYLFDKALAKRVWQVVFQNGVNGGSTDRENGQRMAQEILKWGGGRDPWKCLAGALKDSRLEHGGETAMRTVGSWGVKG